MMGRSLFVMSLFLLFTGSALAQPIDWSLDGSHSQISFTARHLGFAKVRGEFKKFTASKVTADAKKAAKRAGIERKASMQAELAGACARFTS